MGGKRDILDRLGILNKGFHLPRRRVIEPDTLFTLEEQHVTARRPLVGRQVRLLAFDRVVGEFQQNPLFAARNVIEINGGGSAPAGALSLEVAEFLAPWTPLHAGEARGKQSLRVGDQLEGQGLLRLLRVNGGAG